MTAAGAPEPLRLRQHGLDFKQLQALSEYLDRIQADADASMKYFEHEPTGGFSHRVDPAKGPQKASMASTATCLEFLDATGALKPGDDRYAALITRIFESKWRSAGLPQNNEFTVSFLLEALHSLEPGGHLTGAQRDEVEQRLKLLDTRLKTKRGGLRLSKYPPTAFLTYKAVKALRRWGEDWLSDTARTRVRSWAWSHMYEESMLAASESPDADYFELAYAVLTASQVSALDQMSPRERRLLQHALDQFFKGQNDDGTWPRSRPLFLYPRIGYAYCYDYELLVQLLTEPQLTQFLYPHLAELRNAAWALETRRVPLQSVDGAATGNAFGWSSEHHGKDHEAESWPTASVFHFCFELSRLVADGLRREMFEYVEVTYDEPQLKAGGVDQLQDLMDSTIEFKGGASVSFKAALAEHFVGPLVAERDAVQEGQTFGEDTRVSAIFYGPPGTSKTRLAKRIAKALGWPLLDLDPSHLTRKGMDNVHAEADSIFGRLRLCDQIVVLLDEFDELVRERGVGQGELTSRFLTTAMLPKIQALHNRRRLVFLVATNHVEAFDAAISRPGRFDVIAPVMPPSAEEKLGAEKFAPLQAARTKMNDAKKLPPEFNVIVGDLTYDETEALCKRIENEEDPDTLVTEIRAAQENGTLNQKVDEERTWKALIESQRSQIRGFDGP